MTFNTTSRRRTAIVAALLFSCFAFSQAVSQQRKDETPSVPLETQVVKLREEVAALRAELVNDRAINKLRGLWEETSFVKAGETQREQDDVSWRLETEVGSDRLVQAAEVNGGELGLMAVDATKNPMWVTFRRVRPDNQKVMVLPGIAKYEYKQLTLALPEKDVPEAKSTGDYRERPTRFESTKGNGVIVYKLIRSDYRRTGR